jgi:hypothetical protein
MNGSILSRLQTVLQVAGLSPVILSGVTKMKKFSFAVLIPVFFICIKLLSGMVLLQLKKAPHLRARLFHLSGWQDSNLRPSGPKPDALTGLRYTPFYTRKL